MSDSPPISETNYPNSSFASLIDSPKSNGSPISDMLKKNLEYDILALGYENLRAERDKLLEELRDTKEESMKTIEEMRASFQQELNDKVRETEEMQKESGDSVAPLGNSFRERKISSSSSSSLMPTPSNSHLLSPH
jgi:hypothetical protein